MAAVPGLISLIIPVFNDAARLGRVLAALPAAPDLEIIVVDGGSTDGAQHVVAAYPHVAHLSAPRGRGVQMNLGALASRGELLVFLHADTRLGLAHLAAWRRAVRDPSFQAGAFWLALDPPRSALRFIAWGANRRSRLFGLPYGDQVLMLRRGLFFALGGYVHRRPEDLDLVLRLRRHTLLRLLNPPATTSARRWLEQGYLQTTLRNWVTLGRHLVERVLTRRWAGPGDIDAARQWLTGEGGR